MSDKFHVYGAITAVTEELSKTGIAKDSKNEQQGYTFRGIDSVLNTLSGLLPKHQLCVLPRVKSRIVTEKVTPRGTTLFYVVLDVDYDFISSLDGSKHTVTVIGEAMDSGDKASNKAMSAAYKYAVIQAFCIPTQGDNDADKTSHEVAAPPSIPDDVKIVLEDAASEGLDTLKQAWKGLAAETREIVTKHHNDWWKSLKASCNA